MPKLVVFADLDGTVLNKKYEYKHVQPILNTLLTLNVAVVFNSSKTESEVDHYRKKMEINDPFIVENGSAIIIPENYFQINYHFSQKTLGYKVIELGVPYAVIRKKLCAVRLQTGANIVGFGDMRAKEIAKDSGLPLFQARLAKKRQYSEPIKILSGKEKDVLQAISDQKLCYRRGGRYIQVSGNCNKGKATEILKELFLKSFPEVFTIGVGDSDNDLPMLEAVDKPFFVTNGEEKIVWKNIQALAETKFTSTGQSSNALGF